MAFLAQISGFFFSLLLALHLVAIPRPTSGSIDIHHLHAASTFPFSQSRQGMIVLKCQDFDANACPPLTALSQFRILPICLIQSDMQSLSKHSTGETTKKSIRAQLIWRLHKRLQTAKLLSADDLIARLQFVLTHCSYFRCPKRDIIDV